MNRIVAIAAVVLLVIAAGVIATRTAAGRVDSVAAGIVDGSLATCESPLNCVTTTGTGEAFIEPLQCDSDDPFTALVQVLDDRGWPVDVQQLAGGQTYLAAVATTRVLRFRDDVEFLVNQADDWIRVRSASRVGQSDLGANRARVEALRADLLVVCSGQGVGQPRGPTALPPNRT